MLYPFADLWYLVSLVQFVAWKPFAVEMRHTVAVHTLIGCVVGYTTVGRFLSLQRTVTHMPYFLIGNAMRKHGFFFSWATTVPARTFAVLVTVAAAGGCAVAVYAFGHKTSMLWEGNQSHEFLWGSKYKWGCFIQLAVYAASVTMSAAFFALVPPASAVHVQEPGGGIAGLTPKKKNPKEGGGDGGDGGKGDEERGEGGGGGGGGGAGDPGGGRQEEVAETLGAAGDPLLIMHRRAGEAREGDQVLPGGMTNHFAVVYLRAAKWGTRALCPWVFNFFVLILLEICMYYNDTWIKPANNWMMTCHVIFSLVLGMIVATALSTRPVCMVLGWLLTPPVSDAWVFEDDTTIEGDPNAVSEPPSPA